MQKTYLVDVRFITVLFPDGLDCVRVREGSNNLQTTTNDWIIIIIIKYGILQIMITDWLQQSNQNLNEHSSLNKKRGGLWAVMFLVLLRYFAQKAAQLWNGVCGDACAWCCNWRGSTSSLTLLYNKLILLYIDLLSLLPLSSALLFQNISFLFHDLEMGK